MKRIELFAVSCSGLSMSSRGIFDIHLSSMKRQSRKSPDPRNLVLVVADSSRSFARLCGYCSIASGSYPGTLYVAVEQAVFPAIRSTLLAWQSPFEVRSEEDFLKYLTATGVEIEASTDAGGPQETMLQMVELFQPSLLVSRNGSAPLSGCILGIEPSGIELGCRYALLSQDPLLCIEEWELESHDCFAADSLDWILLALPEACSFTRLDSLLRQIEKQSSSTVIGLLYPFGTVEKELCLLKAFLQFQLGFASESPHYFLYGEEGEQLSLEGSRFRYFFGAKQPFSSLEPLFEQPSEVAYLSMHGSGADYALPPFILCSNAEGSPVPDRTIRSFPCFFGDFCHRMNPSRRRIGLHTIRSRVLVALTCHGVSFPGAPHEMSRSLVHQSIHAPSIASIITCASQLRISPGQPLFFARAIASDISLGEAVRDFNRAALTYQDFPFTRMLLFGDPRTRRGSSDEVLISEIESFRPAELSIAFSDAVHLESENQRTLRPEGRIPDTFFQNLIIQSAIREEIKEGLPSSEEIEQTSTELEEAIQSVLRKGALFESVPPYLTSDHESLQRSVHGLLISIKNLHLKWVRYLFDSQLHRRLMLEELFQHYTKPSDLPAVTQRVCPYCRSAPTGEQRSKSRIIPAAESIITVCPMCGFLSNGFDVFHNATIETEGEWRRGSEVSVGLMSYTEAAGDFLATGAVYLPSAIRTGKADGMLHSYQQKALSVEEGSVLLSLPSLKIPQTMPPGLHELRGLLMLDERIVFLHRYIHVSPN